MGYNRWNQSDWDTYSTQTQNKTQQQIFTSSQINQGLDPLNLLQTGPRVSDPSPNHPDPTPILIMLDVTGSMGYLATEIAKNGLGIIAKEIIDRKPVSDPAILLGGIGDILDEAPLQVTQFEHGVKELTGQLEKLWIEGKGHGNGSEGYNLAAYLALTATKTQARPDRKGYVFTLGDEGPSPVLTPAHIKKVFGTDVERSFTYEEILAEVQKTFNVFHLVIEQGHHCQDRYSKEKVFADWRALLGERTIPVVDYTKLAEIIVSIIQVTSGQMNSTAVAGTWSGDTSLVVQRAVKDLQQGSAASTAVAKQGGRQRI